MKNVKERPFQITTFNHSNTTEQSGIQLPYLKLARNPPLNNLRLLTLILLAIPQL
jgi:hypothetical protein